MDFKEELRQLFQEISGRYEELRRKGAHRKNLVEGDIITEVDEEMTGIIRDHFEELEPVFALQSEELGKSGGNKVTEDPDYTVIFDEIDGTANMRDQTGPFGPIVGIAEGEDPCFGDIIAAAYLNLNTGTFYEAYRGEGAFRTGDFPAEGKEITSSRREEPGGEPILSLLIDQAMLGKVTEIAENAWRYWCNDYGSMGHSFAMVAEGTRDGFISGGHGYVKDRKTGEEIAGMYLIANEAGGTVTDWSGKDIAREKVGMDQGKNHDIIAAATEELAEKISRNIIPEEYRG